MQFWLPVCNYALCIYADMSLEWNTRYECFILVGWGFLPAMPQAAQGPVAMTAKVLQGLHM